MHANNPILVAWRRWDNRITRLTELAVFVLGVVFSSMVFCQVVLRYAFSTSVLAMDEVASYMFVWFVFLGGSLAVKHRMHAALEFLINCAQPALRKKVVLVGHGLTLAFFAICLWASIYALPVAAKNSNLALGVSLAWAIAALPVGFALMAYQEINQILYRFITPEDNKDSPSEAQIA